MFTEPGVTEFTTISLSGGAPSAPDRREGQRYMTVLQAGKIVTDHVQELCLIRNISAGGMMAEIFVPLEQGETVAIEFKAGAMARGLVRWVENGRTGIEFIEPIDVHKVLAPNGNRLSPRSPRLNIDGMAEIEIGDDCHMLQVFDISQGGLKVARSRKFEIGLDVMISIEGLPVRSGVVRWIEGNYAGIGFNRVMPLDQVAYWAAQQRPRQRLSDLADTPAAAHG